MFEQDVKKYLTSRGEQFADGTSSHTALDFHLTRRNIQIDAKEKRQKFSMNNWKEAQMPQEFLFIIDDLAVRKLLLHAPNSFSIIRDSSVKPPMHYVFSIVDFLCMPRKRCRRTISKSVTTFKGKWLVDLRDAAAFEALDDAMTYILHYNGKHKSIFENHLDCWGNYRSERIGTGGTTRTAKHWREDAKVHR
ncbi:MAG: hypothetical protein HW412_742 [Bacteroidetes bacterium]|nr:hypothetical protein [Bacteroidota bacterium]